MSGSRAGVVVACGLVLACASAGASASSPMEAMRFRSERIRMTVVAGSCTIHARYAFTIGDVPDRLVCRLPFPVDASIGPPRWKPGRWSDDRGSGGSLEVRPLGDEWYFALPANARGPVTVDLEWQHERRGPAARYVLRSARSWGSPLDSARLELAWNDALGPPAASYPLRFTKRAAGHTEYVLTLAPFHADRDLVVAPLAARSIVRKSRLEPLESAR